METFTSLDPVEDFTENFSTNMTPCHKSKQLFNCLFDYLFVSKIAYEW